MVLRQHRRQAKKICGAAPCSRNRTQNSKRTGEETCRIAAPSRDTLQQHQPPKRTKPTPKLPSAYGHIRSYIPSAHTLQQAAKRTQQRQPAAAPAPKLTRAHSSGTLHLPPKLQSCDTQQRHQRAHTAALQQHQHPSCQAAAPSPKLPSTHSSDTLQRHVHRLLFCDQHVCKLHP